MAGENGEDDRFSKIDTLIKASRRYQEKKDILNGGVGKDQAKIALEEFAWQAAGSIPKTGKNSK